MMKKMLRSYLFALVVIGIYGVLFVSERSIFSRAIEVSIAGTWEMLAIIPPIFVLLGLLDVWVPREVLSKFMGPGSGIRGTGIAFVLGSAAAGPLYAAFPVAAVLMSKGASFFNVLVLIGVWSTAKLPMLLFEFQALGAPFALTRLLLNIPAILAIAWVITRAVPQADKDGIYERSAMRGT